MEDSSSARQRLVQRRLAAVAPPRPRPIPKRPPGPPPLSPGQAALLYHHRASATVATYNVVHRYRIRGPLDVDRFGQALRDAASRHEPLRTSLGATRRTLAPEEAVAVDAVAWDEDGFVTRSAAEAARRFDLEDGPLVRAAIGRLGSDDHGVVLSLHHATSDAQSLTNLWRDIERAYRGQPLPPLDPTYSDHVAWQRARCTDEGHRFWADHLGRDPRPVRLPLAAPTPAEPAGYHRLPLPLSADHLTAAGLRPVPFLLSVLAVLAQRCTDEDDIVIGLVASTRDHPAVEPLVGYFLNTLPLRLAVDPSDTPVATVGAVQATAAAAMAHRQIPYADTVAGLRRRGVEQPDTAQLLFVFDEPHVAQLPGCTIEVDVVHNGTSAAPLTVFARRSGPCFELAAEWDGARYGADDVRRLLAEYRDMALWAAHHPSTPWLQAPRRPDLVGPALSSDLQPVTAMVAVQAPDAPAVRCGDATLDYGALWARSGAIAAALRGRGIGRGHRVGVLLERSVDLVAVVLGVLRAGAAYVPVDPSYPPDRIRLVLAASAPTLTIVAGTTPRNLPGLLVGLPDLLAGPSTSRPGSAVDPALDDPAYVMFTSGSTGSPKGVSITHAQLAGSTLARVQQYGDPVGAFLMVSSISFDSSVAGLFWTLTTGGELIVPTEEEVRDVDALAALAERAAATHTLMVPALYRALLARASSRLGSLRCAIVAGEACPPGVLAAHSHGLPGIPLFNEYGPTEATVWATVHRCREVESPVPIGRPVPGVTLRVADRWLRPRPPGVAGELAIGGPGVAAGYIGGAGDATDPFAEDRITGERFYRTGDLVRQRADDTLLFLGRLDRQLNVGGVRLEPEEVEGALDAMPEVSASVVRAELVVAGDPYTALAGLPAPRAAELLRAASTAPEPASALAEQLARWVGGREELVAYVEAQAITGASVRERLLQQLPRLVVPARVEVVPELGRNEHGKVDRRSLPPEVRWLAATTTSPPSRGGLVDRLVELWGEALGDAAVDADSDFFDRGGDSLGAVELATLLEARLGCPVPVTVLLEGRTPRRLAELLDAGSATPARPGRQDRSPLVELRPGGHQQPLVLLPAGSGRLVGYEPLVRAIDPAVPVFGLEFPAARLDERLPQGVEELCERYVASVRRLTPGGPHRLLGWSFGGVAALTLAQRLRAEGDAVELVVMVDAHFPGMQRAGRARLARDLVRRRDGPAMVRELTGFLRRKLRFARVGSRCWWAMVRGIHPSNADLGTWNLVRVDGLVEGHRPPPYDGPVLLFAASGTHPWRTVEPWSRLLPRLEVVHLAGDHAGPDGPMSPTNAELMARELAARMG